MSYFSEALLSVSNQQEEGESPPPLLEKSKLNAKALQSQ
jgi:hypothetical protein